MTARSRLALVVSAAAAMIVALDGTVLVVAQPSLRRDLAASVTQVQWTSTGYMVAVAALLVIAGRLGDRYGHRRLLVAGVLGFAAASAGIALAPTAGWVIGLRVVQGVFGAFVQPATLALLRLAYPADRLGTAIAIRTSAIGVAGAAGPVLGGVVVAELGWRTVFVLNIPAAVLIAALTLAVRAPAPERPAHSRLDLTGAALLAGTLAIGVHTLAGVPVHGWTAAPTLLGLLTLAGLTAVFVAHERRAAHPIVPAAVARSMPVTASMLLLLAVTSGVFGALFAATFVLQERLGLGPLATGLRLLPVTVVMVLGAPAAAAALRRHGPRRTAVTGATLVVVGIAGGSGLGSGGPWAATGAAFALVGAGFAAVMVTATGTVVGDAPAGYAGVVGGLKQTVMNIGPSLGIAVAAGATALDTPAAAGVSGSGLTLPVMAGLATLGLLPAALLPAGPAPRPSPAPAGAAGAAGDAPAA
ncbi:MFS transporter [Microbispora sp. H10836]|uniref:MFS transporter n=1 Tax=Microbispora sp. H10836 TaxID=2729106 RepID=UPI001474458A|nr:MFS transporter [Microbispora sp. H10836]